MKRNEVLEKLSDIFKTVFDDENLIIGEETTPIDVDGWDSLSQIGLINEIESTFNIKFSMNEILMITNVKTIVDLIESK